MSHSKVDYREVDAVAGAMHFLREPLGTDRLGVTVVEAPPGWAGKAHDHADRDHEEVYLLLDGGVTVTVDGEAVDLEPGDALRVDPDAERQIQNGNGESMLVLAGAP